MSVPIEGGSGGRGGRKSVDADLLLVPYIDLLTCMVAFLLIAAVWTQLARLEVAQKGQGEVSGDQKPEQTKLAVLVHQGGFAVIVDREQHPVPSKNGAYDYQTLTRELQAVKASHADKSDLQVLSEDPIKFDTLVQTMDVAMAAGFPALSLLDAAANAP
jgi:biopolymer transport protein TolR